MRRLFACLILLCVFGAHAQERAIDKEVVVPAPLAQVWASWTTKAGIESFFAPEAEIDPRVDGAFHLHMDPYAEPGLKGADTMRYMALQPMKMLSFDWNAPPSLPEARKQRTFVVVRFFDVDGKSTRVTLHHVGWGEGGEWDRAYTYFNNVWGRVLGNLKTRYEFGPMDWSAWLAGLKASHAASAPAR
ncbi:MAG TPA: SRPBCC domain-containing protein [Rhizobacter sp.]|nr:SRPBCC domain-containing protein [Rhizobacter sp.]